MAHRVIRGSLVTASGRTMNNSPGPEEQNVEPLCVLSGENSTSDVNP